MTTRPLACASCHRKIGPRSRHFVISSDPPRVVCGRCAMSRSRSVSVSPHSRVYPRCPVAWHDLWDHNMSSATRAEACAALDAQGETP